MKKLRTLILGSLLLALLPLIALGQTVQFQTSESVAEVPTNPFNVTISISENPSSNVTVDVVLSGTAGASEYTTLTSLSLTFTNGGSLTQTVGFNILNEDDNTNETIILTLQNLMGPATIGTNITHTITINDDGSLLPIELTAFTGKRVSNTIHLGWETATEKNNDYMEVQRSRDGKRFEALQPVQSKAGDAGTSLVPLSYTFIDDQPLPGINYYRIKQVDLDGAFEYHKTIAVLFKDTDGKSEGVTVFPTLTNDQLNIALATEATADGELYITNLAGQVVLRRPFERGMQQQTVDVHNLPQGQYFITIQTGRTVQNARFVKK